MVPGSRPNIIMIVMDSARPEWLSCYDPSTGVTPNIDQIANDGIVFENAISPSAWTFPVMASVFTGMLPAKHGGHDEHRTLDSHYPTMAEVLHRNGYDTAAFADVPYVGPLTNLHRGFNVLSNMRRHEVSPYGNVLKSISRMHRMLTGRYQKTFETRVVLGESEQWLSHGWDRSKPFFLYVHSDETHAPFLPPARYRERYTTLSHSQMHAINQDKQLYVGGVVPMSDKDFSHLASLARAETAYLDEWLGRFLGRLERKGLLRNSVIVLAADHGDNFGEHGLMRHGLCLYDTLLHVPLILRLPDRRPVPRVRPMVQLIDLLPTFMQLAEIDEPDTKAELQGTDLLCQIGAQQFSRFAVSELYRPSSAIWERKVPQFMDEFRLRYDRVLRSIRTNTHKFIWASNGKHELFDLSRDPGEITNVADIEPALARDMNAELGRWLESFTCSDRRNQLVEETPDDDRVMERLRDLGYVE